MGDYLKKAYAEHDLAIELAKKHDLLKEKLKGEKNVHKKSRLPKNNK